VPFEGKRTVVTGGAGGIGALLVDRLRAAGADILVIDRIRPEDPSVRYAMGDLSSFDGIGVASALVAVSTPDILINLAGVQYFGPTELQTADQVVMHYMVNLVAPVLLARAQPPGRQRDDDPCPLHRPTAPCPGL